jgi:threonylcarbamoyladenosine tRNA methylthiotransferase MtaB
MNSQNTEKKRFFIHTLGCKVNQYESQVMRELLQKAGYKNCLSKELADIFILNTCTVTHHADRESRHWIGLFHRTNPKAKIIVTGCYVENDSDQISFLPGVELILNNADKMRIADFLNGNKPSARERKLWHDAHPSITNFEGHTRAFVKIQDGCLNNCAYCKVPLVRNTLRSKPIKQITEEITSLVNNGYREIILAGICLGAWGEDLFPSEIAGRAGLKGMNLVDVLKALDKIDGEFRIRLSSIEPQYVTSELIDFMSRAKRICRHLHIPLQSGDDEILKRMNRRYTADEYRSMVEKARSAIKDLAVTTDIIVGFPGESERSFQNTLDFVKSILPARTHIFKFSRRKGTAAYDMPDMINDEVAKARYQLLRAVTFMSSYIYRYGFLEKELNVLVESKRDRNSGLMAGYSDNYIRLLFDGPEGLAGRIVPVKVKDATLMYTLGEYSPNP